MPIKVLCSTIHLSVKNITEPFEHEGLQFKSGQLSLGSVMDRNLVNHIGFSDIVHFDQSDFLYYFDDSEEKFSHSDVDTLAEYFSIKALDLIQSLWFIKDNSVSLYRTYLESNSHDVVSRWRPMHFTTAEGTFVDSEFSIGAIQYGMYYNQKIEEFNQADNTVGSTVADAILVGPSHVLKEVKGDSSTTNRLYRAWSFIVLARTQAYLPLKISMYMSAFEALFTSDSELVSHKIAFRCAKYLGGNKAHQVTLYETIRTAYNIRSKHMHGQALKTDDPAMLKKLSHDIDQIARRVMIRIIDHDSDKFRVSFPQRQMDEWYASLLF